MKVHSIKNNKNTPINFVALKVAQVNSIKSYTGDVFIYTLQKDKDTEFCQKLMQDLLKADEKRMPISAPAVKNFIKNAISSVQDADSSVIALKDNLPFGFFSVKTFNNDNVHLSYITTWRTPDLKKVKHGGSMLMNYLLKKFQNKKQINLTPAFNSDLFYYKFGFDYEDEYEAINMFISSNDIKHQLNKMSENFNYKDICDGKETDLLDIVKL